MSLTLCSQAYYKFILCVFLANFLMLGYTEGIPVLNNNKPTIIRYHRQFFTPKHNVPSEDYNNKFDRINLLSLESEEELEEIDWSELI
ncbi:46110_t:CDS:2 [Gigaspora margarita]|uniref:46110_t:CDS:1 n=1 Tax=Gigaspora margarita TaxID=4874 RepID=A0ABN7UXK6_GIGMA|nr:46110_t:CDS:2 [Gigaspora margarita]